MDFGGITEFLIRHFKNLTKSVEAVVNHFALSGEWIIATAMATFHA